MANTLVLECVPAEGGTVPAEGRSVLLMDNGVVVGTYVVNESYLV